MLYAKIIQYYYPLPGPHILTNFAILSATVKHLYVVLGHSIV